MDSMSEAARAAERAYKKEWRAKNPEKVKAARARFWEKRATELQKEQEAKANANAHD